MTHYLDAYPEHNGRQRRAVCGAWIYSSEHSAAPECLGCQAWIAAEPERDADYEALLAEGPATNPVSTPEFDPCEGYTPKRKITRQEQLEGLADRGVDTWDDYRGER